MLVSEYQRIPQRVRGNEYSLFRQEFGSRADVVSDIIDNLLTRQWCAEVFENHLFHLFFGMLGIINEANLGIFISKKCAYGLDCVAGVCNAVSNMHIG